MYFTAYSNLKFSKQLPSYISLHAQLLFLQHNHFANADDGFSSLLLPLLPLLLVAVVVIIAVVCKNVASNYTTANSQTRKSQPGNHLI